MPPHYHHCPICFDNGDPCPYDCDLDDYIYEEDGPDAPIFAHPIHCSSLCRLLQYVLDRKFERQRRARQIMRKLGHCGCKGIMCFCGFRTNCRTTT